MIPIPKKIKTLISSKEITQVENWWEKLNPENQKELESLYLEENPKKEKTVSIFLCGKYVEQERPERNDIFWVNHLYNYIVNHELKFETRTFHVGGICSANKSAADSIKSCLIPANFVCPEKKKDCLMRSILDQEKGKSLLLSIEFKIES